MKVVKIEGEKSYTKVREVLQLSENPGIMQKRELHDSSTLLCPVNILVLPQEKAVLI
jgi:hypothetical protein